MENAILVLFKRVLCFGNPGKQKKQRKGTAIQRNITSLVGDFSQFLFSFVLCFVVLTPVSCLVLPNFLLRLFKKNNNKISKKNLPIAFRTLLKFFFLFPTSVNELSPFYLWLLCIFCLLFVVTLTQLKKRKRK